MTLCEILNYPAEFLCEAQWLSVDPYMRYEVTHSVVTPQICFGYAIINVQSCVVVHGAYIIM